MNRRASKPETAHNPPPTSHAASAFLFNLGLALFVTAAAWRLFDPSLTNSGIHLLQAGLCYGGLMIAAPAWILGAPFTKSRKLILALSLVAGIGGLAFAEKRDFDADESVLQPWRAEGNRLVHDGLGLTFATLPDWNAELQPHIVQTGPIPPARRTRLGFGEKALFLQMTHEQARPSGPVITSSILLGGSPDTFFTLSGAINSMCAHEAECAATPGVKVLSHTQIGQLSGIPAITFSYLTPDGMRHNEIMFRSGSYILTLFFEIGDEADLGQLNQFMQSISITGRTTELAD